MTMCYTDQENRWLAARRAEIELQEAAKGEKRHFVREERDGVVYLTTEKNLSAEDLKRLYNSGPLYP